MDMSEGLIVVYNLLGGFTRSFPPESRRNRIAATTGIVLELVSSSYSVWIIDCTPTVE